MTKKAEIILLKGKIETLKEERDNLEWLLSHVHRQNNPGVPEPDWYTVAASLREIQ